MASHTYSPTDHFKNSFAAYCLARVSKVHVAKILTKISRRPTDNVIKLLFDMNRDLVETNYILPQLKKLVDKVASFTEDELLERYFVLRGQRVRFIYFKQENEIGTLIDYINDIGYFIAVLRRLFPDQFRMVERDIRWMQADLPRLKREFKKAITSMPKSKLTIQGSIEINKDNGQFEFVFWLDPTSRRVPAPWIKDMSLSKQWLAEAEQVRSVYPVIEAHRRHRTKAIDELLGLA